MLRAAVFASGNGSNFNAIIKAKNIDLEVVVLVCNKKDAYVINRAKENNVEVILIDYQKNTSIEIEEFLIKKLNNLKIDLILLAGFLKKLTPLFINAFLDRIINIHPSLLPKYKGLNAIERALDNDDKIIGVSVHYVNENLDDGKIILQDTINISGLSNDEIYIKVHELEHKLYVDAIRNVIEEVKNV